MEYIGILLGWFLGLLSALLAEITREHYRRKRIRKSILAELYSLQGKMLLSYFATISKTTGLSKGFLEWYLPLYQKYGKPYVGNKHREEIERLREITDEQWAAFTKSKMSQNKGISMRSFHLPYIGSNVQSIELFSETISQSILRTVSDVQKLNEQIEDSWMYFKMTFDSSMSEVNRNAVQSHLDATYSTIANSMRDIIEYNHDLLANLE